MTILTVISVLGVLYVALDMIFAYTHGRCMLPGLKCRACLEDERRDRSHERS